MCVLGNVMGKSIHGKGIVAHNYAHLHVMQYEGTHVHVVYYYGDTHVHVVEHV